MTVSMPCFERTSDILVVDCALKVSHMRRLFLLGQTNLIFRFAGKTLKKIGAGGHNKNKNIMNFQNITLVFKRV